MELNHIKMKRLLFAFIISLLLSASVYAFSDVPEDHPNYTAITTLQGLDIIGGYPDGTFKPDQTINRVEALKILLLGSDVFIPTTWDDTTFSDTDSREWYAPYLIAAVNGDIVSGYPDGTFKPLQTVNLVEALKMLLNTNQIIPATQMNTGSPYKDADASAWYNSYLWTARNMNLVEVDKEGNINPAGELTRGKMAEMMYRIIWINSKNELKDAFEEPHLLSYRIELELNNLDVENESDRFDFDALWSDADYTTSDMWMGSLSINGYWTQSMDWQVVDMTKLPVNNGLSMEEVFDSTLECPEDGYGYVDNPDAEGFGEPRRAYSGAVYCLRTNEYNYAKIEILESYSENSGDDKYLKIRYIYRPDGSQQLP